MKLPPGYFLKWTGQYEFLERIQARMRIVVPLTLADRLRHPLLQLPGRHAGADRDGRRAVRRRRRDLAAVGARASTPRSRSGSA